MYGSLFKPCLCWWNILFIHATLTPNFFVFIIILRIIIFWMMITIQTLSDVCFQSLFPVPVSKSRLAEEVSKISLGFFFYLAFCPLKASSNEILLKPFGSRNYIKVSFGLEALNLGKCCHTDHVACGNWYSPHSLCSLFLLAV